MRAIAPIVMAGRRVEGEVRLGTCLEPAIRDRPWFRRENRVLPGDPRVKPEGGG
jgi:hypothetical protein